MKWKRHLVTTKWKHFVWMIMRSRSEKVAIAVAYNYWILCFKKMLKCFHLKSFTLISSDRFSLKSKFPSSFWTLALFFLSVCTKCSFFLNLKPFFCLIIAIPTDCSQLNSFNHLTWTVFMQRESFWSSCLAQKENKFLDFHHIVVHLNNIRIFLMIWNWVEDLKGFLV